MSPLRNKQERAADVPIIGAVFPDYPVSGESLLICGSSARHRWTHFLRQTIQRVPLRNLGRPHHGQADFSLESSMFQQDAADATGGKAALPSPARRQRDGGQMQRSRNVASTRHSTTDTLLRLDGSRGNTRGDRKLSFGGGVHKQTADCRSKGESRHAACSSPAESSTWPVCQSWPSSLTPDAALSILVLHAPCTVRQAATQRGFP